MSLISYLNTSVTNDMIKCEHQPCYHACVVRWNITSAGRRLRASKLGAFNHCRPLACSIVKAGYYIIILLYYEAGTGVGGGG